MRMQLLLALKQVVGIDALGESLAARERRGFVEAEHLQRTMPGDQIAIDVPDVSDVAGGGERSENVSDIRIHFDARSDRHAGRCLRQRRAIQKGCATYEATRGAQ
jgi:hypothetical protein